MSIQTNSITSYAGFTIGPIYDVLSHARKTRELWFGSYFFSWFMEKIAEELSKNSAIEFLVPYVEKPFQTNKSITGKYHDRFIIRSSLNKEELYHEIQNASNNALEYFVCLIDDIVKPPAKYIAGINKNNLRNELKDYIQRNFVVFEASAIAKDTLVKSISSYLDSMEENRYFDTGILGKTCFICQTLPAIAKTNIWSREYINESYKEAYKEKHLCPLCFIKYFCFRSDEINTKINKKVFRYPPVLDISAGELLTDEVVNTNPLFRDYEKDYDFEDIEKAVKDVYKKAADSMIKPYHKYLAIIQADGDNLGEVLKQYTNPDDIPQKFSKPLLNFAREAERLINSYQGYPSYIGGDDILAFTPVAFKGDDGNTKTVFDLAVELSDKYKNVVDKNNGKTALSIGMNIAYYKSPLSMALRSAREQLSKAKEGQKNALAILLTKHSGHQIAFKFSFNTSNTKEIKIFSTLLRETLAGQIDIPHTLHHNLFRFKTVIARLPDANRLRAFFENNFDEPLHTTRFESGIEKVRDLFEERLFSVSSANERLNCINDLLSKLAFIKFLRGDA
jgi:CRISPR-associated protein Cmr2